MLNKLRALGLIIGLIRPVADLVKAIAAVQAESPRIFQWLKQLATKRLDTLFAELHHDIGAAIESEPSLQALRAAIIGLQAAIEKASEKVQGPKSKVDSPTAVGLLLLCVICAICGSAFAQAPSQFVAAGVSWNQYAAPQISGSLLYAHRVAGNTFSFSLVDITSKSVRPFTVQTSISTGLGQHMLDVGRGQVYAVTTVGLAAGAENVGGAWTGGGAVVVPVGKRGLAVMFSARTLKTSLAGWQGMYTGWIGWGK
jgi:hypothetical protein